MKKVFTILILFFLSITLLFPYKTAFGQTPTAQPTEEEEQDNIDTIERIKDLVASKVAELDLVERRGILGTVKNTTNTQITLTDQAGNQRNIDIDELTEFENGDDDDFGISDIDNGTEIAVVGLYNKDNERLLARFLTVVSNIPVNIDGAISEIDDEEFTITVVTTRGETWTADIETSTDTYSYDSGETKSSGFSRLEVGQRVIVVGFEDMDEEGHMSASRITQFISIPPLIPETTEASTKTSTGSAGTVEAITD